MRALLLALAVLLAGCVQPPEPQPKPAQADAPAAAEPPATGSLLVVARFTDLAPLAGVNVTVGNESRVTDGDGRARFDALPVGTHALFATKTAHRAANAGVEIRKDAETVVEVVLAAADGQHAHKPGFAGHTDLYRFVGHFDCAATYAIITGDCLIVVENVTHTVGLADPSGNTTSERYVIDFPLDLGWSALVVEMNWTEPDPPTADGMTLALEPSEAPPDGHAAKYARVHGSSPLYLELRPGVKHPTATQDDMPRAEGGEVLRARAFLRGLAHNAGGTPLLGVGAAQDVRFTLWVSTFYGTLPPEGYSALASS